jgi:hypothetical protein
MVLLMLREAWQRKQDLTDSPRSQLITAQEMMTQHLIVSVYYS